MTAKDANGTLIEGNQDVLKTQEQPVKVAPESHASVAEPSFPDDREFGLDFYQRPLCLIS